MDDAGYYLKFKILAPYSLYALVSIPNHIHYFSMLFLTIIWGRRLRRRMKGTEGEWIILFMVILCFFWLFSEVSLPLFLVK